MVKVTIKFDPDEYSDTADFLFDIAYRQNYRDALYEITNNLWRNWKHDDTTLNVETLRYKISEILEQYNLTIQDFDR